MSRYPEIDPRGAVVLITGGGRGIGAATARAFAAQGAKVWLGDRDLPAVEEVAAGIGTVATARELDVRWGEPFAAFAAEALEAEGRIDVLVNNAGVMPLGAFLDESEETSATTLDVNLRGPINGVRAVAPAMVEAGRGHIVNIVSMAGKVPIPGMAVYNASKFGMVGFSSALRLELEPHGVSVSSVLPAAVKTGLVSGVPLGRGLPAVEPERIAREALASLNHRREEIPVPRYLGGWGLVEALTPAAGMRLMRRAVAGNRAMDSVDPIERADYDARVASQADKLA